MDCMSVKIVDTETGVVMGRIQWFDLKASIHKTIWSARWGRTRTTPEGNTLVLRSTDLSEAWTLLDIYEGSVQKITYDEEGAIDCIFVTTHIRVETQAVNTVVEEALPPGIYV